MSSRVDSNDLLKIGTVTLLGLAAFIVIIFWLKGHKIHHYDRFTFYFRNVNGLEEGNALRWNGLKIGVVEEIEPVRESFDQDPLPADSLVSLGRRHLLAAKRMLNSNRIDDLLLAQESISKAQLEIALGKASAMQTEVIAGEFVAVTVVVTMSSVPIGPLNQATIVPSGLIGEQYVDITTIDIDEDYREQFDCTIPRFVVLEPIRLDTLIRANAESAEAVTNLANRFNAVFSEADAKHVKQVIKNLDDITDNFSIWKLF